MTLNAGLKILEEQDGFLDPGPAKNFAELII